MSESSRRLQTFSPDGHEIAWSTWDGGHTETLSLTWDNEAWTAVGRVGRERVEYVLRLAPTWHVRQFLLFRDLEDPDLWLAIDADHRWGEVNGSYRTELNGCADVELACTPFTATVPIRRLQLAVGEAGDDRRHRHRRRHAGDEPPDRALSTVVGSRLPTHGAVDRRRPAVRRRRVRPRRRRTRPLPSHRLADPRQLFGRCDDVGVRFSANEPRPPRSAATLSRRRWVSAG